MLHEWETLWETSGDGGFRRFRAVFDEAEGLTTWWWPTNTLSQWLHRPRVLRNAKNVTGMTGCCIRLLQEMSGAKPDYWGHSLIHRDISGMLYTRSIFRSTKKEIHRLSMWPCLMKLLHLPPPCAWTLRHEELAKISFLIESIKRS